MQRILSSKVSKIKDGADLEILLHKNMPRKIISMTEHWLQRSEGISIVFKSLQHRCDFPRSKPGLKQPGSFFGSVPDHGVLQTHPGGEIPDRTWVATMPSRHLYLVNAPQELSGLSKDVMGLFR